MITKRRNIKLNDIWKYEQGKAQIGKKNSIFVQITWNG